HERPQPATGKQTGEHADEIRAHAGPARAQPDEPLLERTTAQPTPARRGDRREGGPPARAYRDDDRVGGHAEDRQRREEGRRALDVSEPPGEIDRTAERTGERSEHD